MRFNLTSLPVEIARSAREFLYHYGHKCAGTDSETAEITAETGIPSVILRWIPDKSVSSLRVAYDGSSLVISGQQAVHFYRGLHLALMEKALEQRETFEITEKIAFDETGIMLDCSRNAAPALPFLKEVIRLCAACGIGQLYLYMEDLYEIPEEPYFGAFRGRYKREELQELDAYGRNFGVELIPTIQTLAHLHTYLRWNQSARYRDTEDILLAGSPDTEMLVRRMIRNASMPFSTKKIHVGMDEAAMLGLGQYLRNNGYRERYRIMTDHLEMVCRICEELGVEPMMWSDMFFRLKSPSGGYYDLPEDTEFILSDAQPGAKIQIPGNLSLVYWDYYHHDGSDYEKNIRLHRKLTDRIVFAGGGWTWNGLSPNYRKAERTLAEGVRACREQGIRKLFCTFWFDNGAETPVRTLFFSALYFARLCYPPEKEDTERKTLADIHFNKWLELLTGYSPEAWRILDKFDSPAGILPDNECADNPSKFLFYQDVMLGLFDEQTKGMGLDKYYRGLAKELELVTEGRAETPEKELFIYYRTVAQLLAEKAELGTEIRQTYLENDRKKMKKLCEKTGFCVEKVREMKELRGKIWFEECRPFGYEVLDIRFGGVAVRLESARRRLEAWISGEVEHLEELEEDRLPYAVDRQNKDHRLCAAPLWEYIVSAGNMAGI